MLDRKGKIKIIITFTILFLVISLLLLLIYVEGKPSYKVTFDLNGGTLISGSTEQYITRGQDATPPTVVKGGAYLHSWSASYKKVTKDIVIEAIWEYDTTPGVIYSNDNGSNFTEIVGSYEYIHGDVYLGAYYNNKTVLGVCENAFAGRSAITKIFRNCKNS